MGRFGLTFHHLGLALRKPEPAQLFLEGIGYRLSPIVFDSEQCVNLIMCEHDEQPFIELIFPASEASPVDGLLARHAKGLIYHACYVSENLEETLASLAKASIRPLCISPPKPAVLFAGASVSFYQLEGIGLIEIIEGPLRKAPRVL